MKNPLSRFLFVAAALFASALCACAPMFPPGASHEAVSTVPGPDGEEALLIKCEDDASQCARMAARLCPTGYALHGMGQATPGVFGGGKYAHRSRGTPGFMFVTCDEDPSVVRAERARARCRRAYSGAESFAAYWSTRRNRSDRRAEYPHADEFETACTELPARAQRCMQTRYRSAHVETCDAALDALATTDAQRIDALFFE